MATKKAIFISYDLGLKGDYPNLYTWLDKKGAKECGDSVAFITSDEFSGDIPSKLEESLRETITFSKNDRVYIIYWNEHDNKLKGKFIIGSRKRAIWEGYGHFDNGVEDSI